MLERGVWQYSVVHISPKKSIVLRQYVYGKIIKNQTIKVFYSAFGSVSINIFRHWILSDFGVLRCEARSWTRWSLWVPSSWRCSVIKLGVCTAHLRHPACHTIAGQSREPHLNNFAFFWEHVMEIRSRPVVVCHLCVSTNQNLCAALCVVLFFPCSPCKVCKASLYLSSPFLCSLLDKSRSFKWVKCVQLHSLRLSCHSTQARVTTCKRSIGSGPQPKPVLCQEAFGLAVRNSTPGHEEIPWHSIIYGSRK